MNENLKNINEVTYVELSQIAFLGPARCSSIIDYLDMHDGNLENVMELARAEGIGESIATQLTEHFSARPLPEGRAAFKRNM